MLKKSLFCSMITAISLISFTACSNDSQAIATNTYNRYGVVSEIEPDAVVVEDTTGNLWAFEDIDSWQVGDAVTLEMNDCGTETIYDDIIVNVK